MYKKVSLFLLVVFLVLIVFSITTIYCYNMLINNEKIEDASIYTNIIEGWNNSFRKPTKLLNEYYYVEPIGQMIFATDANNKYMYAYGDGERFLELGTNNFVKDKNNNYIYASAGDATYQYLFYATSTDKKYEYMYAGYKGGSYYTFDNFEGPYNVLKNENNQEIKYDSEKLNNSGDVSFNKDAKVYYIVSIIASSIGLIVLISLLSVFIIGKVKEKEKE